MPGFAANLSLMYGEHAFLDRFAAAAADGFDAVELQFPYDHRAGDIAARLRDAGLEQVLINAPPGDLAAGERGLAALPGREAAFRRSIVEQALPFAQALGCRKVHVMAGLLVAPDRREVQLDTYRANLAWACAEAASGGIELLIEPLNPFDAPGYLLRRQDEAHAIVADVGAPNLKVQMDLYHLQVVEGDVSRKLRRYLPSGRVGHLQVAGVPDRHEPDSGEMNAAHLFALIDELGWDGWVGAEYRPRGATADGLGWFGPYRRSRP